MKRATLATRTEPLIGWLKILPSAPLSLYDNTNDQRYPLVNIINHILVTKASTLLFLFHWETKWPNEASLLLTLTISDGLVNYFGKNFDEFFEIINLLKYQTFLKKSMLKYKYYFNADKQRKANETVSHSFTEIIRCKFHSHLSFLLVYIFIQSSLFNSYNQVCLYFD